MYVNNSLIWAEAQSRAKVSVIIIKIFSASALLKELQNKFGFHPDYAAAK
jgi:hypothetical protein